MAQHLAVVLVALLVGLSGCSISADTAQLYTDTAPAKSSVERTNADASSNAVPVLPSDPARQSTELFVSWSNKRAMGIPVIGETAVAETIQLILDENDVIEDASFRIWILQEADSAGFPAESKAALGIRKIPVYSVVSLSFSDVGTKAELLSKYQELPLGSHDFVDMVSITVR